MIELSEEQREGLLDKVCEAIDEMEAGLEGVWDKYEKWRKYAENRPLSDAKTYPHSKAANVAVPLLPVAHRTMFGALFAGLAGRKPPVLVQPIQREDPAQKEEADVIAEYLQILTEDDRELGMKSFLRDWLADSSLVGLGFDKVVYDRTTKEVSATRTTPEGGVENIKYVVEEHDGVRVLFRKPENVLWDQAFQDLNRTPVLAEYFELSKEELETKLMLGEYVDGEKVLGGLTTEESSGDSDQRERTGAQRGSTEVAGLYECHVLFDQDEDGGYEDLICVVHKESRSLLYCEFNSFGERMLGSVAYENRPGWLQGQGIGWKVEHMQEVTNTLYNSRMDGIALTEVPIYLIRRGSGIPLSDEFFPGKRIQADDLDRDFKMLFNEKGFQNTREEERGAMFWAQKNTGASDSLAGFPDGVMRSSDTVGGQVLRLKQSNAMYATVLDNYEQALSDIYRRVFKTLVLHKEETISKERKIMRLGEEKIAVLERALSMKIEDIPLRLRFRINTTDVDETFEMQRQNLMTMTQLTAMYFEKAMQLGMIMDNQQIGPTAKSIAASALEASTRMMRSTLDLFDREEVMGSLPDLKKLEMLKKLQEQIFGMKIMVDVQGLMQAQGGMNGAAQAGGGLLGGPGGGQEAAGAGGAGEGPQGGLPGGPGIPGGF